MLPSYIRFHSKVFLALAGAYGFDEAVGKRFLMPLRTLDFAILGAHN